jgi:isoleucyl-tRNA synthetase
LKKQGSYEITVENETFSLTMDDFELVEQEKAHIARTETGDAILLLDTELTSELVAEGFAREIVRRIQSMRKEMDLAVEHHITTMVSLPKDKEDSLSEWNSYIKEETRSKAFSFTEKPEGSLVKTWDIDDYKVTIGIQP